MTAVIESLMETRAGAAFFEEVGIGGRLSADEILTRVQTLPEPKKIVAIGALEAYGRDMSVTRMQDTIEERREKTKVNSEVARRLLLQNYELQHQVSRFFINAEDRAGIWAASGFAPGTSASASSTRPNPILRVDVGGIERCKIYSGAADIFISFGSADLTLSKTVIYGRSAIMTLMTMGSMRLSCAPPLVSIKQVLNSFPVDTRAGKYTALGA